MGAVLPDLPSRRPPRLAPSTKPSVRIVDVLTALEKFSPRGSTTSEPGPLNALLLVVGALFRSTNVVSVSMSVAPVWLLLAVSVSVLPPLTETLPVPLMALATVTASLRLKLSAALLVTDPPPKVPDVAPLPICSVPALMVVVPL